jgi:threonylcarbamoyladenosine tRNA methylthiotransferase MtaB
MRRLRVSSLQPQEITPDLLVRWDDDRLCPHFHMPLQSGSAAVLKRMRRRYSPGMYEDAVDSIRQRVSGAAITADVIVGFPGETESDFDDTVSLCQRVGFAGLHVFPYSKRPGTSAAHFGDQVPVDEKSRRMKILLALAEEQAAAFRRLSLGQVREVLWESSRSATVGRVWSGLTDNYIRVNTVSEKDLTNAITDARLVELRGDTVTAEVVGS